MTLTLRYEVLHLTLRDPFVIARPDAGPQGQATTVIVELRDDRYPGLVGIGEGFPDRHHGETPGTIEAAVPVLMDAVGAPHLTVPDLEDAARRMALAIGHHGAAKCAIDIALHDLGAQIAGQPLAEFLGLPPTGPPTDFTLGIDDPQVVAERAGRANGFPSLKIKLGGPADLDTLLAVRAVFDGPLRVDANEAWDALEASRILPHLERLGVELIEQPFPARRLDLLVALQAQTAIPVIADESAVTIDDLPGLAGLVAGVNVKLAKCGGVGPARRMLDEARRLGFRTLLGCRQETSVGIAASASLASLADWVDLDGNLLLDDDPFEGLDLGSDARWTPPPGPGLGLRRMDHGVADPANQAEHRSANVLGTVWAGVRTDRSNEMRAFVRDVLGAPLIVDEPAMAIFRLGDTSLFEVLGQAWVDAVGYPTGPVVGFWVTNVDAARSALEDAGTELVGPTFADGDHRWQHFRAPDGNLYQVASGPYGPGVERITRA